jgi:electron transport complex protein RnfG
MKRIRPLLKDAAIFAALAAISGVVVSAAHEALQPRIRLVEHAALNAELAELIPDGFDNDPAAEALTLRDSALAANRAVVVRKAVRASRVTAVLFDTISPDGYNGDIALRIGVDAQCRLTGLQVLAHHETVGLTRALDPGSPWTRAFAGRALDNRKPFALHKDGGEIDQISGATHSARAIVSAARNVLEYASSHRETLFEVAAGGQP